MTSRLLHLFSSTSKWPTILLCMTIAGLSILLQSVLNLGMDIGTAIDIARRIADGQHLYREIYEVNPPSVFYLELPVVFLADHFHWSDTFAAGLYHNLLAVLSLALCFRLLHLTSDKRPPLQSHMMMIFLCFSLLLLPILMFNNQFGQREHFFIMLTLPYFISVYCWPIGKTPYSLPLKIIIGVLAGIGFTVKPFFVLAFAASEAMRLFHSRRISVVFSVEIIISGLIISCYPLLILFIFPEYIHHILPLASQTYFFFRDANYALLRWMAFTLLFLTGGGILFLPIIGHLDKSPEQRSLLALILAMIITGILQMKGWSNHFYPAVVMYFLYLPGIFCLLGKIPTARNMLICLNVALIINYPFQLYPLITSSNEVTERAAKIDQLLDHTKPATTVYCFCTSLLAYPLINLNHYRNVSQYQHLWMVSAAENALDYYSDQPQKEHEYSVLKANFIRQVTSNFIATKPDILIKEHHQVFKWGKQIDIFDYMAADPRFDAELAHYTVKADMMIPNNEITIYQRK